MFKFDLKSGYHHIEIHKDCQKYLCFSWKFADGTTKYFQFAVLPFGLSSAPYIFTKIVRVLIKYWRSFAIKISCFIDDGLAVEYSEAQAKENSKFVRDSLSFSGFVVNVKKSEWEPKLVMEWLGVVLDFRKQTYRISEFRISSIFSSLEKILKNPSKVSARQLARFTGKFISTKFVLGNIVQLKTRNLYKLIESRISWDKLLNITFYHDVIDELMFWKLNLLELNKRPIIKYNVPSLRVFSDASSTGIGAIFDKNIVYRNLESMERSESSTYRELLAILHAIETFDTLIQGNQILWHTDNFAAAIIVKKGSNKPKLQHLANSIYFACKIRKVSLSVTWISRVYNADADTISKAIDYDDWKLTKEFYKQLIELWGPFTIDLFADNKNFKCKKFCFRYWSPEAFRVDAFSFDWGGEHCLIVPPIYLIPRVIKHFLASVNKASGVLIVPYWPSAPFWPFLVNKDQNFRHFIKQYRLFEDAKFLISPGEYNKSIFTNNDFAVPLLALLIST